MLDLKYKDLILDMFEIYFVIASYVTKYSNKDRFVRYMAMFVCLTSNVYAVSFAITTGLLDYALARVPKCEGSVESIYGVGISSTKQPHNVFVVMKNVLILVLEESKKIPTAMVEVILLNLLSKRR